MSVASEAEAAFKAAWLAVAPPGHDLAEEYLFHDERKWRFDFAFPSCKLAVEIDGRGRHQTVGGVRNDCDKNNEALRMGWRIVRFPATDKRFAADWARTVLLILVEEAQRESRTRPNDCPPARKRAA